VIVKVLKSPFTARPVIRINDRFNYSAHRVRIGYTHTLNARYALTIGCTDTAQTVDIQRLSGATSVAPILLNNSHKGVRERLTALHQIDVDRVTRCTVIKSIFERLI
jgi:hypothetical protein